MALLKVLSYNIHEGGVGRVPEIVRVLRGQQADAIALAEATNATAVSTLAQALGLQAAHGEANNGYHLAWLSRLPFTRIENHRLPQLAKTLLEVELVWDTRPLHLFATHLASRWDRQQPADEVASILAVLRRRTARDHLLGGDFNALSPVDGVGTTPRGEVPRGEALAGAARPVIRKLLDAGYVDCYRALHPDAPGYTYRADALWLRLDYLFASPTLAPRLTACDVVCDKSAVGASDHVPLWAAFLGSP